MSTDVEDLLREGMQRFTAGLRAPAGLTRRAVRRRRRRLALRSAAAAAAALTAGAVALAAVVVPGGRQDGAAAAAYVVKRVNSALSAAGPGQIAQMTVTDSGALMFGGTTATTVREWSYGGEWRSVTYSPAGHLVYDEGLSSAAGYTLVDYQTRTWARQAEPNALPLLPTHVCSALPQHGCVGRPATPVPVPRGCEPAVAALPFPLRFGLPGLGLPAGSVPATVATALRTAISCGTLAVAGRQRVDGIDAIKLTSRPDSPVSETIWVSPGTYLPVRVVVSAAGLPVFQQTADITWLPPTAQNLAELTVPVPAGFRRVPLAEAVWPVVPRIPAGPLPNTGPLCVSVFGPAKKPAFPAPALGMPAIPRPRLSCSASSRPSPGALCLCKP